MIGSIKYGLVYVLHVYIFPYTCILGTERLYRQKNPDIEIDL
jgi:hypothetical protein